MDAATSLRHAQILSASPAQRVVLLYEGAIRYLNQHLYRLEVNDLPGAHAASIKAQAVIDELQSTLDLEAGGQIAKDLNDTYAAWLVHLAAANVRHEPAAAQRVLEQMKSLLESWRAVAAGPAR